MNGKPVALSRRGVMALGAALAGGGLARRTLAAPTAEPVFDSHAHLISPDLERYPQVAAEAPGSAASFPPLGFRQLGTARPIPEAETMLGWMKGAGVVGAAAVQKRGTYGVDNRYILDSAARFPDRFFPVVILEAQDAATPATVARLVGEGLAGVRLTGVMALDGGFPWLASDEAYRLWAVAAQVGLVMDLMPMPFGHPPEALPIYADLARRFPGARLVIDHLNWPLARGEPDFGLDAATRALAAYPNIFFKFTTLNIDKLQDAGLSSAAFLAHAVEILGAGRVLWGSDMGNSPGAYAELVGRGRAAAAHLAPAVRRAVLHDTGRALFTARASA